MRVKARLHRSFVSKVQIYHTVQTMIVIVAVQLPIDHLLFFVNIGCPTSGAAQRAMREAAPHPRGVSKARQL
jgi:hypothetical protein